ALQKTPDWKSTAVVVSYDDSDGWYDHAYSGVTNPCTSVGDALTGTGACGSGSGRRTGPLRLRTPAFRCWCSPRGPRPTASITRSPTSPRSSSSSRTTGTCPASPAASTPSPEASTASSTSPPNTATATPTATHPTPRRTCSTRAPDSRSAV